MDLKGGFFVVVAEVRCYMWIASKMHGSIRGLRPLPFFNEVDL